jgi:hypothetical protein
MRFEGPNVSVGIISSIVFDVTCSILFMIREKEHTNHFVYIYKLDCSDATNLTLLTINLALLDLVSVILLTSALII